MARRKTRNRGSREGLAGARARARRDLAVAYLNALLDRADPEELAAAFARLARACGGARLAEKVELSADTLYRALCRRSNPDLRSATLLLKAMGMRLVLQPIAPPGAELDRHGTCVAGFAGQRE
jgi:probable addiction module antidote protein